MVKGSEGGGSGPRPKMGFVAKPEASVESVGGRTRITVELFPEQTTVVSWKKLLKEADKNEPDRPGPSVPGPETQLQPTSQRPIAPLPAASSLMLEEKEQNESKVQANLSSVIERIERMYAGDDSSNEDAVMLDNVPDEDKYDTDDSFIDDAELNDYFKVDNSKTIHEGFYVNRGKLDRVESTVATSQQPNKRKCKDLTKTGDAHNLNKLVKTGIKGRKASSLIQKSLSSQSHKVAMPNVHGEDMQFLAVPANTAEASMKKKTADLRTCGVVIKDKDIVGMGPEILSSKNHSSSKGKEIGPQYSSTHWSTGKSSLASKSHSGKQPNNVDNLEKGGLAASLDPKLPTPKVAFMPRKKGSSSRWESTTLEEAIMELKQTVAESMPPSTGTQDPDNASQAVKRRLLSPEIKKKLAKVARLAFASYGTIPINLINRLMDIVGHLMKIRTLKRNLRDMANMGLSAKKEKDDRIERIKQEVADMVKQRIPYMRSKTEQQAANLDDFQEVGPEVKDVSKRRHNMDAALGIKICELYDLYAERAEEDAGPPVRKLYQELVVLWPSGFMDTDGIKRAIYRAKEKRCLSSSRKDREKTKKKMVVPPRIDDAINVTKALRIHDKSSSDSPSTLARKPVIPSAAGHNPIVDLTKNGPNTGKQKLDAMPSNLMAGKKIKKRSNPEASEDQLRLENMEQWPKLHKHVGKSN
ncbi:hypothetical protein CASFOL_021841 [Castilleja foliolosa]|uniref:Hpc2-related domain-containing protein n=1 Tax=Castilleja foliolosa TaxID=1961234 RepID=A0ABD3D1V6_9LAMI